MEPFTNPDPDRYSKVLGLNFKGANTSGKIWVFAEEGANFIVEEDSDQVLHGRLTSYRMANHISISAIYAKCSRLERHPLWDKMREISFRTEGTPWLIGGDFNTILAHEDRVGSETNRQAEMIDFAEAIEDCRLLDPGFDGAEFTWAKNGLFERLDRLLVNEAWSNAFEATRVTNLPRVSSDHGPILARCKMPRPPSGGSAFRFQNMWVRHGGFLQLVQNIWAQPTEASGLLNLQTKLARSKKALKAWNKEVFGNIHANLKGMEEGIAQAQADFEADPTPHNRSEINKSIADWVKQKRVRLRIHSINVNGREIADETEIRHSVVEFFRSLLAPDTLDLGDPDLDLIQQLPPSTDLEELHYPPNSEEVKKAVFDISGDSAPGPDGFSAVISPNQSGFVKGRLLHDNALLAQEMFHELARCSPAPNVAIKIDMAKAYDRVQWSFLIKVLRRMGFSDGWIALIERCIGSCWFSVLINGVPAEFFKSTRGLRQGDPISPALFMIAAEYLSRALDKLILGKKEMTFKAARRCMEISHLAYADDIIIFTQAAATPLRLGMSIPRLPASRGLRLLVMPVKWHPPKRPWVKVNTDGVHGSIG
ncbi:uncharacterized protein LOC121791044 [Salvia splendens]|uniref:uncharacterized protein LOC121791044 n=1 Tax=Salvia splendens TaxID=180675 RepID=UPI001C25F80C|nr:uncharacterized protein LOC121791044 [Salvia splendens]